MTGNSFLAIDLSEAERHHLAAALHEASPGPRIPGRRTKPENWHITVRFLGQIDEVVRDRIAMEIDEGLDASDGKVHVTGLGAFPRASKATVMYAAVDDPAGILDVINAQCEQACRDVGLEPEERPFVPHLTLARIRPQRDVRRLIDTFSDFSVRMSVDSVALMHGEQGSDGLRYVCDTEFSLG